MKENRDLKYKKNLCVECSPVSFNAVWNLLKPPPGNDYVISQGIQICPHRKRILRYLNIDTRYWCYGKCIALQQMNIEFSLRSKVYSHKRSVDLFSRQYAHNNMHIEPILLSPQIF